LVPTLPQGSVGPCAVLWCPLVGVLGAASVSALLFHCALADKCAGELQLNSQREIQWRVFYVPGDDQHWGSARYRQRVADSPDWWTCDQETKAGDYALLYARAPISALVGIIKATGKAKPDSRARKFTVHHFTCRYRFVCTFDPPHTLRAMRDDKQLSEAWGFVRLPMAPGGRPPRISEEVLSLLIDRIPELRGFIRGPK